MGMEAIDLTGFGQERLYFGGVFLFRFRSFKASVDIANHPFAVDQIARRHSGRAKRAHREMGRVMHQRKTGFHGRGEFRKIGGVIIHSNADNHQALGGVLLLQLVERRK